MNRDERFIRFWNITLPQFASRWWPLYGLALKQGASFLRWPLLGAYLPLGIVFFGFLLCGWHVGFQFQTS